MILPKRKASHRRRDALTLLQLLVVVAIIAVLVGMLMAAVMVVPIEAPETRTRTEIAQVEAALNSFMQDHHLQGVPSALLLREDNNFAPIGNAQRDALATQSNTFLLKVWGRNMGSEGAIDWNGNGQLDPGDLVLDGPQVLTFLIGGIPSPPGQTPQGTGFSHNKVNPSASPHLPPYFTFDSSRLLVQPTGFYYYADPWRPNSILKPYAFFSTNGVENGYHIGDCANIGAQPYYDTNPGSWAHPSTFQILSAGRNGVFGGQGSSKGAPWSSINGTVDPNGKDDQTSFSPCLLQAGNQ